MSLSKYRSQKETANLARLIQIIVGPCSDTLRAILSKKVNRNDLRKKINIFVAEKKNPQISKEQKQLIDGGNYSHFDITLLYFLLRNISGIPPHTNGWGNHPSPTDRSVSANVERIRMFRNKYCGHSTQCCIFDSEFEHIWKEAFQIVKELEQYLGTSTVYQDAMSELKSRHMDHKEILNLPATVENLKDKVDVLEKEIVPWNVKVTYERDIADWREADNVFIETHTFKNMLSKVLSQPFMTIVGAPGSGKTATARHIALKLQEKGYEILPIRDIGHIETYCDPHNQQVFVIDDVLGSLGLDMSAFFRLNCYSEKLKNPTMPITKVLMTCREVVFRNENISISVLSNKSNVILLNSEEHGLNVQDKQRLLSEYKLDTNILTAVELASSSNMFPLLCKFFSTKKCFEVYGPSFFITPIPCILKGLDELSILHKIGYASLVLLMVNQNILSKDMLDNTNSDENANISNELKFQILAACRVDSRTDSFCFIVALLEMVGTYTKPFGNQFSFIHESLSERVGTYTKSCGIKFTFIHESLLEIVAYHFGSRNSNLILKCMNSDFIANYIKLETCNDEQRTSGMYTAATMVGHENSCTIIGETNPIDLCVKVSNFKMLAERLYSDIKRGELFNVFGNKALKHSAVLKAFIGLMERESYEELHSVFLSELKTNIVKHIYGKIKRDQRPDLSVNFEINLLLMGLGRFFDGSVRAISWVIYYGHAQILQCIIDRIMKTDTSVDSLFRDSFKRPLKTYSDKQMKSTVTKFDRADKEYESTMTAHSLCNWTGRDLDKVTIEQYRLLCLSCYSGDLNTVRILLKHVYTKRIINGEIGCHKIPGMGPLVIACFHGYFSIAKELINAGASVNLKSYYWTPIAAASHRGHLRLVEELIKAGADVNIGFRCKTPLELARFAKHNDVVEKLNAAGTNAMGIHFYKTHQSWSRPITRYIRDFGRSSEPSVRVSYYDQRWNRSHHSDSESKYVSVIVFQQKMDQ